MVWWSEYSGEKKTVMRRHTGRQFSRSTIRDAHWTYAKRWRRIFLVTAPLVIAAIAALVVIQLWIAHQWISLFWRIPLSMVLAVFPTIIHDRYVQHMRLALALEQEPAEKVLRRCLRKRAPFALFLRSFETEQWQNRNVSAFASAGRAASPSIRPFEKVAALALDDIPMIALRDPCEPADMPGALRLTSMASEWITELGKLLPKAKCIIVYISKFTRSICEELELIEELGIGEKCLLFVEKNAAVEDTEQWRRIRHLLSARLMGVIFERSKSSQPHDFFVDKILDPLADRFAPWARFDEVAIFRQVYAALSPTRSHVDRETLKTLGYAPARVFDRMIAFGIDFIVLAMFALALIGLIRMFSSNKWIGLGTWLVTATLVTCVYFALSESLWGRSGLGKSLRSLTIRYVADSQVSIPRSFVRAMSFLPLSIPPLGAISLGMLFLTKDRRSLHDQLTRTRVVSTLLRTKELRGVRELSGAS